LSGGALPVENGVVISLARMNRILEVDLPNARVIVEPGVINLDVTGRVQPHAYFYAPDPSSQSVCSIGGNVAENSGGAHCLKYGFTTTHVLGLEVVLPDGSLVHLGGKALDMPGYDLMGVFVGSEGTLGIATKVTLRIVKRPECIRTLLAAFPGTNEAGAAVSDIIAAGMLPAAIEMMDNLAIQAAEAAVHPNYPDCGGLLLVELDGPVAEVEALMRDVDEICRKNGAWEVRLAQTDTERMLVWKGRKAAFAAMGRISPNYIVQDGVIPRTPCRG
jgi:glycolate oxidase